MYQKSIINPISFKGIGIHSGREINLTLRPAKFNTGIIFVRSDVKVNNVIKALYNNVIETELGTVISSQNNIKISTIEHLMAALWGLGICNLIIEVDGPEIPIMDGSSIEFMQHIEKAGTTDQKSLCKILKIKKEISFIDKDTEIHVIPNDKFEIDMRIDFKAPSIGEQKYSFNQNDVFKEDISKARTFGFASSLDYLKNKGLAKGASIKNAIALDDSGKVINKEGLRYDNELVRHKVLDAIGDFLLGSNVLHGKFICNKTGHYQNNMILRKIFSNSQNYEFI